MNKQTKYAILLAVFVGVLIGAGVAYLASHVGRDAMSSDVREEPVNVKTHEEKTEKKVENIYNIGITEEEFRQRFNKIADEYEFDLRLTKKYVYEGTYANVYQTPLDTVSSIAISYEPKTGFVRGIFISGTPATDPELVRFISAIVHVTATLNPDLPDGGVRELLPKLGIFDGKHTDYRTVNKTTSRNNISYKLQGTGGKGVIFFAVAKDISTDSDSSVRRDDPHNIMADMTNYVIWDYSNQNSYNATMDTMPNKKNSPQSSSVEMSLGGIAIGDTKNRVYSMLGRESRISYEGSYSDPRYQYPNMEVVMSGNIVTAFVSKNAMVKTGRGIGEGNSVQDVLAAYGKADMIMEYDGYLLYEYKFISANGRNCLLRFAMKNGTVSYISGRVAE
mgnify:FL=1